MDWYGKRRVGEENTAGLLVRPITEKLQQLVKDRACRYCFHMSTSTRFEVVSGITMVDYLIDLEQSSCSCRFWQSLSYPCGHALVIIMALKHNPQLIPRHSLRLNPIARLTRMLYCIRSLEIIRNR